MQSDEKTKKGVAYEPPRVVDLSEMNVKGQVVQPMGTCAAGTGPGYCNPGINPVDDCSVGSGASSPATCSFFGSNAALTCFFGSNVYATDCSPGTRPFHCTPGSRA